MIFAFDQFLSTVLGGHPDDTISQRLGRSMISRPGFLAILFAKFVDFLAYFLSGEKNHCIASLSGKTSARELWNWGGNRSQINVREQDG